MADTHYVYTTTPPRVVPKSPVHMCVVLGMLGLYSCTAMTQSLAVHLKPLITEDRVIMHAVTQATCLYAPITASSRLVALYHCQLSSCNRDMSTAVNHSF